MTRSSGQRDCMQQRHHLERRRRHERRRLQRSHQKRRKLCTRRLRKRNDWEVGVVRCHVMPKKKTFSVGRFVLSYIMCIMCFLLVNHQIKNCLLSSGWTVGQCQIRGRQILWCVHFTCKRWWNIPGIFRRWLKDRAQRQTWRHQDPANEWSTENLRTLE